MKKLGKLLEKPWAAYTLAACAGVAFYMLLGHFSPILRWLRAIVRAMSPIIIGIVLAYITNPIANFIEERVLGKMKQEGARRNIASLSALFFLLLILAVIIRMLVPSLIGSITKLIENSQSYFDKIDALIQRINESNLSLNISMDKLMEQGETAINGLLNNLMSNLSRIVSTAGNVGTSIFNWIIGLIMAVYFLTGKKQLMATINRLRKALITEEQYRNRNAFWGRCHEIFIQYIGCNLLDAFIVGVANALFMLIARVPDVALISVVVGVTNLLPTFGPIIGLVVGGLLLLLQAPAKCILFIIFTLVIQTVDGYIIKPKMFGSSFGIPAVWALIAIILGGKFAGVVGILLATPVAAVIAMVIKDTLLPKLEQKPKEKKPTK